jgi:hypothetical protein
MRKKKEDLNPYVRRADGSVRSPAEVLYGIVHAMRLLLRDDKKTIEMACPYGGTRIDAAHQLGAWFLEVHALACSRPAPKGGPFHGQTLDSTTAFLAMGAFVRAQQRVLHPEDYADDE